MPKGKKLKKASKKKKKEEKPEEEENQKRNEMELLAAAAPLEVMEDLRLMTRKAGLKLTFAAPEVSACENLLHYKLRNEQDKDKEYGILDLGSTSSRLFIFKGDRHQVTRVIERGMEQVEELLADTFHIDIHLAHTWLLANHEDCIHSEVCQDAFSQISVELMRALNFYQFSNPESRLEDIYICGGGASIATMRQSLEENLDVKIHEAGELLERMNGSGDETSSLWMLAAGTALGRTAHAPKKQINLALAGQKKKHYFVAIPAIGAIVVAAGVIGKVAVADRLVKMSEAQSAASELQKQVDDITAYIDSFGDLQETYAHYTYQGLNADEFSYLNRPEVLQLMKNVIFPKVTVSSWSVSGNQLTLPVTGENLSDINSLVQELEQVPIVDYCNVMTAVTDSSSTDENGNPVSPDAVTGQIIVYLLDPLYVESGEGSEEYGVAADSDGNMTGAVDGTVVDGGNETGVVDGTVVDGGNEAEAVDGAATGDGNETEANDGFEAGTEGGAQE